MDNDQQQKQGENSPTRQPETCGCGGGLHEIDSAERSSTVRCEDCNNVYLMVGREDRETRHPILLRDWDQRRGEHGYRPIDDLEAAKKLEVCLAFDAEPSPMLGTDFGIQSNRHYDALQHSDASAYEFDRVLGDGEAITQLVQQTSPERFHDVSFETPYDAFYSLPPELEISSSERKQSPASEPALTKASERQNDKEQDRGIDR